MGGKSPSVPAVKLPPIQAAPAPPAVVPPAPMPVPDDDAVALANKQAAAQRVAMSGRQASILDLQGGSGSGGGTLG